jgi:glycosyltransferase involved in cell wall biosynthesis
MTVKTKVAIIIERADIALGGAERSVLELASALRNVGLDVDVLAAKGPENAPSIHALCNNAPRKRIGFFTFAAALKKYLAENPYDIVHSVLPFDFADVYQPRGGSCAESIQRNAASYQNTYASFWKRATAFANYRRTILLRAERKLCRNTANTVVAALSKYVAEQFKTHYGCKPGRIVVIPSGVKVDKEVNSTDADKLRSQILSRFNITDTTKPVFFLFAANNFRLKGLACLIKAMALTAGCQSDRIPYLIVAGSDSSRKYRRLANELDIQSRIVFLGPLRNIQNALPITDVAVLPTFYDPCSRFILEALAAAKPVITTSFNGAAELFVNGRHGKVIHQPEDVPALAEAMRYFGQTRNIQQTSQAIIEDNLKEQISIDRVADQMVHLYEQIIEKWRQK